jgi:hypothetical protein
LRNELQKILKGFCIPVTFYAPKPGDKPLTQDEMAQLFHDFNFKVVPVPARVAIALDTSDIYIRLTDKLADGNSIAGFGGMEKRAASLGKKSTALVVQQTLYRFVRGATEGEKFQESNREFGGDSPVLTAKTFEDELDSLTRFLDALASNMGARWSDRTSLHLSSPGWQALGVIYHDLVHVLQVPDFEASTAAIARIDWSRTNPLWKDLMLERTKDDGTTELVLGSAGANNRRAMIKALRQELGIADLFSWRPNV